MANDELETWEANGRIVIQKSDGRGIIVPAMVNKGKRFTITSMERELYSDRAATPEQDPFQNGLLSPVRLIEGSEVEKFHASNPNTMTEDDMNKLFKAHWKTFEKKISEVTSPFILQRMLEMANAEDSGATVRQEQLIKERAEEVAPKGYEERNSEPVSRNPAATTPQM